MADHRLMIGTALGKPGDDPPGAVFLADRSATDIALPSVQQLPLIAPDALGISLPPPIEAHLLYGNWYGNGPEIVLWHPRAELQALVPLRDRVKVVPLALAALIEAAAAKEAARGTQA